MVKCPFRGYEADEAVLNFLKNLGVPDSVRLRFLNTQSTVKHSTIIVELIPWLVNYLNLSKDKYEEL